MGIASVASLQVLPQKGRVQNMGRICLPLEQGEAAQLWFNQKQEAENLVNHICQDCALTATLLHRTFTQPYSIPHLLQGAFAMAGATPTTIGCSPAGVQVPWDHSLLRSFSS